MNNMGRSTKRLKWIKFVSSEKAREWVVMIRMPSDLILLEDMKIWSPPWS